MRPSVHRTVSHCPLHTAGGQQGPPQLSVGCHGTSNQADPSELLLMGLGMGPVRRGRRMQYLSGAIWELVGQNVAIDLSRGACPGQYPLRLGHSRRTKVSGRIDVCISKSQAIIITNGMEVIFDIFHSLPTYPPMSFLPSHRLYSSLPPAHYDLCSQRHWKDKD